jgi:hypothetical protein
MMAVRVAERFSITNEGLHEINDADFLPEMTYMDYLWQKIMSFPFFKRSPLQINLKYQPISRIRLLALILLLSGCFLFLTAEKARPGATVGSLPAVT